MSANTI